jgi:hypothetical protein
MLFCSTLRPGSGLTGLVTARGGCWGNADVLVHQIRRNVLMTNELIRTFTTDMFLGGCWGN